MTDKAIAAGFSGAEVDAQGVLPGTEAPESEVQDIELPINVLGAADVRAFQFAGHEVVGLIAQLFSLETQTAEPVLIFIAPEDAGPLGRRLISVASPLKPVKSKESK